MHADDVAVLFIDENFAQAVALVFGDEPACIAHGELPAIVLDAGCLCGFLAQADGSNLGIGIDNGRDGVIAHRILFAQNCIDRHFALAISGMRQHRHAVDVARGVAVEHVRAAARIGFNARARGFHTDRLQADALDICAAAD